MAKTPGSLFALLTDDAEDATPDSVNTDALTAPSPAAPAKAEVDKSATDGAKTGAAAGGRGSAALRGRGTGCAEGVLDGGESLVGGSGGGGRVAGSVIGCRSPALVMDACGSGGWLVVIALPPCSATRMLLSSCDSSRLVALWIASDAFTSVYGTRPLSPVLPLVCLVPLVCLMQVVPTVVGVVRRAM